MTILCIDTATEHGTVAVVGDDGAIASARWRSAGRHGENLFGYIESALAEAGAEPLRLPVHCHPMKSVTCWLRRSLLSMAP